MSKRMTLFGFAAALVAAGPLHAQASHATSQSEPDVMMCSMGNMQHGAGAMHGGAGQMQHGAAAQQQHGAMMGGYAANPGMLLHHTAELGLTADQVERIKALQQSGEQDCLQHAKLAQEQHVAAAAALQAATPNLATFEAKLREAAQHMVQAHVALARRGVEALNLLSAAQRTKLQANKHDTNGAAQRQ